MAEERNTESFALGVIVAAIVFLILRREFSKRMEASREYGAENGAGVSSGAISAPICGCGAGSGEQQQAENPGISIGGESYSTIPFRQSTVVPASSKSTQWYAGSGPSSGPTASWGNT